LKELLYGQLVCLTHRPDLRGIVKNPAPEPGRIFVFWFSLNTALDMPIESLVSLIDPNDLMKELL